MSRSPTVTLRTLLLILLATVTALLDASTARATVLYVDASCGDDAKAGTSHNCTDANGPKLTIQNAIDAAIDSDEIVVAPGTYNEVINFNGKAITLRSTAPSNPEVIAATIIDGTGLNNSVVTCASSEGENTVLDGFTITGGTGSVCYTTDTCGGGMCNLGSSPTVTNCMFTGNEGTKYGGGMYNNNSNPTVTNCTFRGNKAYSGGGMCNQLSSPTVIGCRFPGNTAFDRGGGMYSDDSHPIVTNCTFTDNTATIFGGGMCNSNSSPPFINCTFSGNNSGNGGGMFNHDHSSPTVTSCILWDNSGDGISNHHSDWDNPIVSYSYIQGGLGTGTIDGGGNEYDDPLLTGNGFHLTVDSPCRNSGHPGGDYTGQTDIDGESRVIDAQVDVGADEWLDTDGDGLPDFWERLHFDSATEGDALADEDSDALTNLEEYRLGRDPHLARVQLYVDVNGQDTWDGLAPEWDGEHGPKETIQAAIDAADMYEGDAVSVAPGTYNEVIDFKGKAITLRSTDPSDPAVAATTIIDGAGLNSSVVTCVNGEGSDTVLEGFTITGGTGTDLGGYTVGGGMYDLGGSPTVTNCTFIGNTADHAGGGMYNSHSSRPTVTNCTFSGNSADNTGGMYNSRSHPTVSNSTFAGNEDGGMYNFASRPIVTNCTFADNEDEGMMNHYSQPTVSNCTFADNGGNGMYNAHGSPTVSNCTFTGNTTGNFGGGMLNDGYSSPTVSNCTFSGNRAINGGGGMYNSWYSSPTVINCTFSGNRAINGGGMLNYQYSSPTVTNCTFSGNTATHDGGGMYNSWYSSPTVINCTFTGNTASKGGGMYNNKSRPTANNSTFSENSSTNGRALACDSFKHSYPSFVQMANCIFRDGGDEIWNNDGSAITVIYSSVQDEEPSDGIVHPGTGNIDTDPQFVRNPDDGGDGWGDDPDTTEIDEGANDDFGDLRLQGGSLCINAGQPDFIPGDGETDLDGHVRVLCGRVDMGAYEFGIGDFDCDEVVNLLDFAEWEACMTGPVGEQYGDGCEAFDFDGDDDVDITDFAMFVADFDG